MKRMDLRRNKRGITLVALVITIIVLLILAGITISLTIGEGGIITIAQQAGVNYATAETTELRDLDYLIPLSMQITADNYGDYVNYPVNVGSGPDETAYKTDWRIFYSDGEYVYLIASYLLKNSEVPEGTTMKGFTPTEEEGYTEERPYTTDWEGKLPIYKEITTDVATRYKFNFRYNGSYNNGCNNMKCVSELLDTTKWTKFVDTKYAVDAVGTPTLEMWVASWNEKGYTRLYCNNSRQQGYYIGKESLSNKITEEWENYRYVSGLSITDLLYFPSTILSTSTGGYYWLASPSANGGNDLMVVGYEGQIKASYHRNYSLSVRPVVCLKANITAKQDENGVWQLYPTDE
jgi:hypothetical protein